jgi:hypothetical protein
VADLLPMLLVVTSKMILAKNAPAKEMLSKRSEVP